MSLSIPNYITLIRIFLVPFFFGFLVYYNGSHLHFRLIAFFIFLVAIATDAIDGAIARNFHKQTELGTFLDPFADKLLLLSGFLGITISGFMNLKPPIWVVIVVVFRDLFIVCGLVIIFLTTGRIRIRPNLFGKLTTFFQMLTIVFVLANWGHAYLIWYAAAVLTITSALSYLAHGIKVLNALPD